MISLVDVYVSYGLAQVLAAINLQAGKGERVAILGKNGVGKTTLLKSIIGLVPPKKGQVLLQGQRIDGLPPHVIARRGVGYVPQGKQVFPHLTVEENLFVAIRDRRRFPKLRDEALSYFPALGARLRDKAGTLSGGQQKFLAIARGLISQPSVLLLDEPSEGVQPSVVQELGEVLQTVSREGKTILLVEQNYRLAFSVAERAYIIDRGSIVTEGSPSDLETRGEVQRHLSF